MMKIRKSSLRDCARLALEQRGYTVETVRGSGIIPGARLCAKTNHAKRSIAVRTSLDREVGLTRNLDGSWATIPRVDEVLVAVPSLDDPGLAEILSFAPDVLVRAFDAALTARQSENPDFKLKSPIFIGLDNSVPGGGLTVEPSLKDKSQWKTLVPLTSASLPRQSQNETENEFFDRVRREFAGRHGFDPSKVRVEFSVIS